MAVGSELPRLDGYPFDVRYSDGALVRARAAADVAADAYVYFSRLFAAVEPSIAVVVADEADWFGNGPYGLPFFNDDAGEIRPGVVVMPAGGGDFWLEIAQDLRDASSHFLGGTSVDLADDTRRAVAQTKMTITQRATVHGVEVDVVCTGRFYDLLAKRDGRWGIVLRQPIYEQDRLDPVSAGTPLALEPHRLIAFPVGYRHLAYIQSVIGYDVKRDMPGLTGPEVQALYERGARWLAGETTTGDGT